MTPHDAHARAVGVTNVILTASPVRIVLAKDGVREEIVGYVGPAHDWATGWLVVSDEYLGVDGKRSVTGATPPRWINAGDIIVIEGDDRFGTLSKICRDRHAGAR